MEEKVFFIKSELADRWGVSRQVVNNWSVRRKDFPPTHIINGRKFYHLDDVKRYEQKYELKGE